MSAIIKFYLTDDEFGCFSNFATYPIELDGKTWPTSEHYYQAQKHAGTEHEDHIRRTGTAANAKKMGRGCKQPLRSDWESVKINIMRKALHAKFTQHTELRTILLSTGNATLVEHTPNDSYWGDGGDGTGMNMLGVILMDIRDELHQAAS